ncbi:hypothetical protein [Kribbella lupini]|uniref:Membrane protein DUF2157 n=1 Tax=Kribbella lupini TaxID=291602 RepID=A0ABN2BGA4_9ACTN
MSRRMSYGVSRSPYDVSRLALACYPRWWRAVRGDELQGVLADLAEASGRGRPDPRDLLNLAAHGLRLRLAGQAAGVPGARDRTALIASAVGFAFCLTILVFGELWTPSGRRLTVGAPIYLGWMLSVALTRSWGRGLLFVCAVGAAIAPITGYERPRLWVLGFLLLLTCLAACGRVAPDRRSRRLLLLLTAGLSVMMLAGAGAYVVSRYTPYGLYGAGDQYNVGCFAFAGFGVAVVLWWTGRRVWAIGAGVNGLVWLSLLAQSRVGTRTDEGWTAVTAFAVGVLLAASVARCSGRPLVGEDRVEQ